LLIERSGIPDHLYAYALKAHFDFVVVDTRNIPSSPSSSMDLATICRPRRTVTRKKTNFATCLDCRYFASTAAIWQRPMVRSMS
jgi:hypothetical protein